MACLAGSSERFTGDRFRVDSSCATAGAFSRKAAKSEIEQRPAVAFRSSAASDDAASRPGVAAFRPPPGLPPPPTRDSRVLDAQPKLRAALAASGMKDSARFDSKQKLLPPALRRVESPSSASGDDTATPGCMSDLETCSSVSADSHEDAMKENIAQMCRRGRGRLTQRPKQQGPPGIFSAAAAKAGVTRPPGFFCAPTTGRA